MTLPKPEVAAKPQDNSNTGEMKDLQAQITESASSVKGGPKPKFQTKICDHWRRSGTCSYGDACWYAHGENDLRKVNIYRNNRIVEEKLTGDCERNGVYGSIHRSSSLMKDETSKIIKNPDDSIVPPPSKRASTNIKGLTVNIPQNIAFKEQAVNASMPLSPAQERWISMSVGGAIVPPNAAAEKMNDSTFISSSSSSTMRNGFENELDNKNSMESLIDRRPVPGKFFREEDADDYGFLSPNPFPYPSNSIFSSGNPSHVAAMSSHHRSFSRGPHQRTFAGQTFGGMSSQQPDVPICQEQARISRSGNNNIGYMDRQFPPSNTLPNTRSSREVPPMTASNGSQPQLKQAIWNVAGEIYQRQKDIETCGMRGHAEQQSMQARDAEMTRILSKMKMKDLSYLRYMLDRGFPNERDVSRQTWNELINSGPQSSQQTPFHAQFLSNNSGPPGNDHVASDCSCQKSRAKMPLDSSLHSSHFTQSHLQPASHHFLATALHQTQHHNQQQHYLQSQRQQSFRQQSNFPFGGRTPLQSELAAPPKIFESLLPSDENFSIWLDPKPKKDSTSFLRPSHGIDHSDSGASLLTKMDALRLQKCPISEEEIMMSHELEERTVQRSSSESSSPAVLSLMELLSSENLLEESNERPKTTLFDFDSVKISETLKSDPISSGNSSDTSSIRKDRSPVFLLFDEKTPSYDSSCLKESGIFTPSSAKTPSFMEQCDFFAAGGSCPFGDGCTLSHSIPKNQQQLEAI